MHADAFRELLRATPVISAVKNMEELELCLDAEGQIIFVLFGDVLNIASMVDRLKAAGKVVLVHIDLIEGLATRDIAVDFLIGATRADGILSTKGSLIRRASSKGLLAVQRFFVLDSLALQSIEKQLPLQGADAIEVLPGVMPKVIKRIVSHSKIPVIAGGLIADKEDVMIALGAGAVSVSTTNSEVWFL